MLCGTCKNLGVINADIRSETSAAGIIAGYVGLKGPGAPTGTVENCFTSGTVSGNDAVGGIAGNIGKNNGSAVSSIKNCYSTATVIALNTSGNSRAGGIAGIMWDKGVIMNCYSTGTVISEFNGAGGILAYADNTVVGCVGMNEAVINKKKGNLGRISAFMGGAPVQGENCWGLAGMTLDNGGTPKEDNELITGTVSKAKDPYDGVTQTGEFLKTISNYESIGWAISGQNQVWSQYANSKGYPILLWQYNRGDYNAMSGY